MSILIILGKNSDDKGTQLENLTCKFLSVRGCKNISKNVRNVSGEIDVFADCPIGGKSKGTQRVICECKAHSSVINTPDWLKFLGKVYSEELSSNYKKNVKGYLVALSGVNGDVWGAYNDLLKSSSNITLITGDDLINEFEKIYNLINIEKVKEKLLQFTTRTYKSIDIAYYQEKLFYVITFEQIDSYTVLDNQANILEEKDYKKLCPLVEKNLPLKKFVNLLEELESQKRLTREIKEILSLVIKNGGKIQESKIKKDRKQALDELIREKWLLESKDKKFMSFPTRRKELYFLLSKIYAFMFAGEPVSSIKEVLESKFYKESINRYLVKAIQEIQGNLVLSNQEIEDTIKILKLSPSALLWTLQPQKFFLSVTKESYYSKDELERIDKFLCHKFLKELFTRLIADLNYRIPREVLYTIHNVRDIEIEETIKIKDEAKIIWQRHFSEKHKIAELAEPYLCMDGSKYAWTSSLENHTNSIDAD